MGNPMEIRPFYVGWLLDEKDPNSCERLLFLVGPETNNAPIDATTL